MSNLVLILLIVFFFCIDFFSQFHPSMFVLLRTLLLCFFSGLSLMTSPESHDSGNRSEGLTQVDFRIFFKVFCLYFFASVFFFYL